jgi:ATP-dependent DNA ligase
MYGDVTRPIIKSGHVCGRAPDGLSRFEELRRRASARNVILYAFDLIERNGEDLRPRPFLERKDALARLLVGSKAGASNIRLPGSAPVPKMVPFQTATEHRKLGR